MNAEHLLQGTEPLLRAAVFLIGRDVGVSSDKVVESRGTPRLVRVLLD